MAQEALLNEYEVESPAESMSPILRVQFFADFAKQAVHVVKQNYLYAVIFLFFVINILLFINFYNLGKRKVSFGVLGVLYFFYLKRFVIQEWDIYKVKKKERDITMNKIKIHEDNENVKYILDEERNKKKYIRTFDYKEAR
ncbi:hypothetical protein PFFCH_05733 [Plasmodium falciparum FCH/4]|uniref:Uncharacterized protein n=2 Tax=Plasmodium falciparum TaxID=5833 RepID=A0A024VEX1_PLAFA|nr:hypothetical protein PFFCH_05733 [Plasmodium falciparum FCH/4]